MLKCEYSYSYDYKFNYQTWAFKPVLQGCCHPIGVFTTAIARSLLYEFITLIGYNQVLYCDTDSIFYISSPEIEARIEARNKEKEKKAAYIINSEGKKIYYDVFENANVQKLAWSKYGFRTGITGGTYDVSNVGVSVPLTL